MIAIRVMTEADIPAGMRLKDLAGWNQTSTDWQRFLRFSPDGCFVAEADGHVIGTAATIPHEQRFAWVGMVLVDPDHRRRGTGTLLLEHAINFLDRQKIQTIKLDATPQGRPIYERLGFTAEYEIERWALRRASGSYLAVADHPSAAAGSAVIDYRYRKDSPGISDSLLTLDRDVFGADRGELLRSVHDESPQFTMTIHDGPHVLAYSLGRHGSRADQFGPCVAPDQKLAASLLDRFLERSLQPLIFVDRLKNGLISDEILSSRKFEFSRPLLRMVRGSNAYPGKPETLCAILGPEFG